MDEVKMKRRWDCVLETDFPDVFSSESGWDMTVNGIYIYIVCVVFPMGYDLSQTSDRFNVKKDMGRLMGVGTGFSLRRLKGVERSLALESASIHEASDKPGVLLNDQLRK